MSSNAIVQQYSRIKSDYRLYSDVLVANEINNLSLVKEVDEKIISLKEEDLLLGNENTLNQIKIHLKTIDNSINMVLLTAILNAQITRNVRL